MVTLFKLKDGVGSSRDSEREDVVQTQRAFNALGLFEPDPKLGFNGFVDRRLDAAIRRFQRSRGLLETGEIKAGDDTEEAINAELRQANRERGPAGSAGVTGGGLQPRAARAEGTERGSAQRHNGGRGGGGLLPSDDDEFVFVGPGQVNLPDETPIRPEAQAEIDAAKRDPDQTLVFRMWESRQWAIKNDWPAKFNIKDNPEERGDAPIHREHSKGVKAVRDNDLFIEREARRQGVEPDLIRAIMYVENADGSRFGISRAADRFGLSDTLFPMNINPRIWDGMGGVKAEDFKEAEFNIRASVALIKAIDQRIEDGSPKGRHKDKRRVAKIGTIWNFTGRENVNDLGARIQRAFDEKLWAR